MLFGFGWVIKLAKHNLELELNLLLHSCLRSLIPQIGCLHISQMEYTVNYSEHWNGTDDDRSQGVFITLQIMRLPVLTYVSDMLILLCSQVRAFLSS